MSLPNSPVLTYEDSKWQEMICGEFVRRNCDSVSEGHVVCAIQSACVAPVASCVSQNTREDATLLITWRGPTLRPRGPPLASTWLGAGTITRTGLREITGRVSSCVCVLPTKQQTNNTERRKEKGERPNEKERASAAQSVYPETRGLRRTEVPRVTEKQGTRRHPANP